ncbi:MAG: LuxR C-terminal-related transcriptional regulator [Anaeromyxobacter sp.]
MPGAPQPPSPASPPLRRERLERQLAGPAGARLLLLLAPGGYGKTCALRAWWAGQPAARAWLAVPPDGQPTAQAVGEACQAAGDGWLVVDGTERLEGEGAARLAGALLARGMGRTILSGRHARALPLAAWRGAGALQALDAAALALDGAEWAAAGLPGEAADWGGWWGARLAAARDGAPEDPELAAWLREAWAPLLEPWQRELALAAALLPGASPGQLGALLGCSGAEAGAQLRAAAAAPGPLAPLPPLLPPRLAGPLREALRARDPSGFERFVRLAVDAFPGLDATAAAEVALASGLPAAQERVLASAGWTLLFSAGRGRLRALLDRRRREGAGDEVLALAWEVEAARMPHLAQAGVAALVGGAEEGPRAQALALEGSICAQYDDHAQAAEAAAAALQRSPAPHPAAVLARCVLGAALLEQGALAPAEVALREALGAATRDQLPRLQLDAWHRLALLAWEREDAAGLAAAAGAVRALAARHGLADAPDLDALARLEAAAALARLDAGAARAALARGDPDRSTYGADESFPHRTLRALLALVEGDLAGLEAHVAALEQALGQRFLCLKWRAEALLPRVALRARRSDAAGLSRLVAAEEARAWPAGLRRDHAWLTLAGARLLAGEALDAAALAEQGRGWRAAGALALARQAALLSALAAGDQGALLAQVREGAAQGTALPYLWLAPRCVGPLEALLGHAGLAHDEQTRTFLRGLVQRLLAAPAAPASPCPPAAAPPADLTLREWEVLQLVGGQLTNEQIAARLSVSLATVKTHLNRLYAKLGIRSRAEAVVRARALSARPPRDLAP